MITTPRRQHKQKFSNIHDRNIFWDQSPKAKEIKSKINKWDLNEKQYFAQQSFNKMKQQMAEWEKIFANDTTNKGLISKIYKRLITTQFEKPNNPMQKIDNGPK